MAENPLETQSTINDELIGPVNKFLDDIERLGSHLPISRLFEQCKNFPQEKVMEVLLEQAQAEGIELEISCRSKR